MCRPIAASSSASGSISATSSRTGDDIYGDGVNVAARLEALAEPGGICVSRVVRDQVRDKLDFTFDDMGEQRVKNIARPDPRPSYRASARNELASEAMQPVTSLRSRCPTSPRWQCCRSPI